MAVPIPRHARPRSPRTDVPIRPGSASLREAEVDLGGRRARPARGDDLRAGVEVDPLGAVDVAVAEERALPAPEAVVGDGNRDRHVDPDHPRLNVELELAGDAAVAREDRGAIAVRVLVDEAKRLVVGVDARHAEDRAEELVAVVRHLGLDVVDQRGPEEEAVSLRGALAAVYDDSRAFGRRVVDIRRHAVSM